MAIVKKYPAKVVTINNCVKGVYTLELESLDKPFKYEPGQFMHLTVDEYDAVGQWPDSRCFSIQSNPNEKNIKITYSVKGKYTTKMEQELKIGRMVWLKLPYGDLFTREHNRDNTVFLAGGTGITPFLSLFNDLSFANYNHPILYAGFRDKSLNFYFHEIEKAKEINPSLFFSFVYEVEIGLINLNEVLKKATNTSTFFISGPPLMIKSFKDSLSKSGIIPSRILTDDWE
jgi:NAD(P)H-flavin reductase